MKRYLVCFSNGDKMADFATYKQAAKALAAISAKKQYYAKSDEESLTFDDLKQLVRTYYKELYEPLLWSWNKNCGSEPLEFDNYVIIQYKH